MSQSGPGLPIPNELRSARFRQGNPGLAWAGQDYPVQCYVCQGQGKPRHSQGRQRPGADRPARDMPAWAKDRKPVRARTRPSQSNPRPSQVRARSGKGLASPALVSLEQLGPVRASQGQDSISQCQSQPESGPDQGRASASHDWPVPIQGYYQESARKNPERARTGQFRARPGRYAEGNGRN